MSKLVDTRISYNDRPLMFLLRNRAPGRFAAGQGARGLNAMDLTRLEQEKRKWRKEWELEHQAGRGNATPAEIRASIDRKVEALRQQVEAERQREWDALSDETRAAWERFEALKARDLNSQGLLESYDRRATSEPQGRPPAAPYGAEPSEPDGSRPALEGETKIRRLKDDGWNQ